MPRSSLKVAPPYIDKVKNALMRNGFPRQQDLAEAVEISRDTVSKFLNGKPINYLNFVVLCDKLNFNWKEIADFQDSESLDIATREDPNGVNPLIGIGDFVPDDTLTDDKLSAINEKYIAKCFVRDSLLFDLLLQMDFKPQVGLVREVIQIHRTAAFLVHGEIKLTVDMIY
ncbi:MAG TPA: hypothetical protein DEG17_20420 [Cyanobacteria bacterium UBA11149]|nr:hypothetical protein [Cyanobacteria bacterium UBA11367]HBE57720.1 hypothetical protein [Cyanobacteria bacterium UBA11366]HBK64508.1 hypothetical protein [Cyanobacteria bacterium UBA11166]HBR75810.1 hypothetical protein [Cyanobacteria bacterium UBA11159]HBS72327.1 hypothetical protein [Cyanobacteria bacterium UBA11153]HBW91161.1 hypothetical protein [Cyanobacteria bacterium UBA11149]HCA94377.1 hypothetical protein [Cyanobacteria bacterium UBA9226]